MSMEPLPPFPPTSGWSTIQDALHEVFADVHHEWVREYLVHSNPMTELLVLTNPDLHSRAIPVTFRACVDADVMPSAAGMETLSVTLFAPIFIVDELIAGISVESTSPVGVSADFSPIPDFVNRLIFNRRTGCNFELALDEKRKLAQVMWFTNSNSRKLQAVFRFDLIKFLSCFQCKARTQGIDFQLMEQALITSVVGEIHTSKLLRTTLPGILGNSVQNDRLCNELRRFFVFGDHYSKNVGTVYCHGQPTQRAPFFLHSSRVDGTSAAAMEKLCHWAIANRISNIQPVIKVAIPWKQEEQSNSTMEAIHDIERCNMQLPTQRCTKAVEIVPNPIRKEPNRKLTYAEEMDARNREKILLRKIKNRQAAARSYARKRQILDDMRKNKE